MADMGDFVDLIHYRNNRTYSSRRGNIAYLDGTPLSRPTSMPLPQRVIALGIIVIAAIIGFMLVNNFVISRWKEVQETEQTIAANLARTPSIESLPNMTYLINRGDEDIRAAFAEAGYKMYDVSDQDETHNLAMYRLPDDVSLDEAATYLQKGLNSLDAKEASKLLEGSWFFAADREGVVSMVARYADFSTGDPLIAVQNGILKEGFDATTISDSGEDESGNTYCSGNLESEGVPCTWKVSALPLKDVYSISGLPDDACYVGVRITRAA